MNKLLKERIYELMEERGIATSKLEKDLGFGGGTISVWDKHWPSVDKVEAVAKYFGVSLDYLLGREIQDGDNYTVVGKLGKMSAHDVKLVKLFNKATENDKKVIEMILAKYDM